MFAEDITQIIFHLSPWSQFIKLATGRAIEVINNFEQSWKIKTNKSNSLITPVAMQP